MDGRRNGSGAIITATRRAQTEGRGPRGDRARWRWSAVRRARATRRPPRRRRLPRAVAGRAWTAWTVAWHTPGQRSQRRSTRRPVSTVHTYPRARVSLARSEIADRAACSLFQPNLPRALSQTASRPAAPPVTRRCGTKNSKRSQTITCATRSLKGIPCMSPCPSQLFLRPCFKSAERYSTVLLTVHTVRSTPPPSPCPRRPAPPPALPRCGRYIATLRLRPDRVRNSRRVARPRTPPRATSAAAATSRSYTAYLLVHTVLSCILPAADTPDCGGACASLQDSMYRHRSASGGHNTVSKH